MTATSPFPAPTCESQPETLVPLTEIGTELARLTRENERLKAVHRDDWRKLDQFRNQLRRVTDDLADSKKELEQREARWTREIKRSARPDYYQSGDTMMTVGRWLEALGQPPCPSCSETGIDPESQDAYDAEGDFESEEHRRGESPCGDCLGTARVLPEVSR